MTKTMFMTVKPGDIVLIGGNTKNQGREAVVMSTLGTGAVVRSATGINRYHHKNLIRKEDFVGYGTFKPICDERCQAL